ncbi:hypothetical protein [Modestobacter sp. SYSU DS0290]
MAIGRRRDLSALRAELQQVEARISAHPLASQRVRAAQQVVDGRGSADAADVDRDLEAQGLPGVAELGRTQVSGTWSWWQLHRRKRQLETRIERARQ